MKSCIFCKIIKREVPAQIEKETDDLIIFKDINPRAAVHLIIAPKKHIKDITESDGKIWQEIKDVANALAKEKSLVGFRLVHNAGAAAIIPHMHVHFLGPIAVDREI